MSSDNNINDNRLWNVVTDMNRNNRNNNSNDNNSKSSWSSILLPQNRFGDSDSTSSNSRNRSRSCIGSGSIATASAFTTTDTMGLECWQNWSSSIASRTSILTEQQQQQIINTCKELGWKLSGDVSIAMLVTASIAPFLTIIDRSIVERSATVSGLRNTTTANRSIVSNCFINGMEIIRSPIKYIRSPTFLWMWFTYGSTYATANAIRTITEMKWNSDLHISNNSNSSNNHHHHKQQHGSSFLYSSSLLQQHHSPSLHSPSTSLSSSTSSSSSAASVSSSTALFVGTTLVNSTVSIMKDRAYSQMFGSNTTTTTTTTTTASAVQFVVPRISYGLWIARDLTVIGSSFVVPTYVSNQCMMLLQQHQQVKNSCASSDLEQNNDYMKKKKIADGVAQLLSPVLAQIIAGPLHYIGLDFCNNNNNNNNNHHQNHSHRHRTSTTMPASVTSFMNRFRTLWISTGGFVDVIAIRMVRVLPGYGIGGVYNTQFRNQWKQYLTVTSTNSKSSNTTVYTSHCTTSTATQQASVE